MGGSISKKSLLIPDPSAKANCIVGCRRVRFPGGPAAQIFFPAHEAGQGVEVTRARKSYPYLRMPALAGIAEWSKKPLWMLKLLGIHKWQSPCSTTALPTQVSQGKDSYPVILFSHGLGGNSDIHTCIAQLFCRRGFVVVVVEHECGAASYARTESGQVLHYNRPRELTVEEEESGYSAYLQLCQKFRAPFLRHRENEWDIIRKNCSVPSKFRQFLTMLNNIPIILNMNVPQNTCDSKMFTKF